MKLWPYYISIVLAAILTAFTGMALSGQSNPVSAMPAPIAVAGQDEAQQTDPSTPPDCKKYPRDPRCQNK